MEKILFLCLKNKRRSPTAENIFYDIDDWEVRSAGLSHDAEVHVSIEDVKWAEYIFVMENSHKKKLMRQFGQEIKEQKVISLDIPDKYEYMDKGLIQILRSKLMRLV